MGEVLNVAVGDLGAIGGRDKARGREVRLAGARIAAGRLHGHARGHARNRDAVHLDLEAGAYREQPLDLEKAQAKQVEAAHGCQLARSHGAREAGGVVLGCNGLDV